MFVRFAHDQKTGHTYFDVAGVVPRHADRSRNGFIFASNRAGYDSRPNLVNNSFIMHASSVER